jgi:general stress protein YciG
LRMKRLTAKERAEIARQGGEASKKNLTPEQRSEIARKAGLAGGRGRKKG